MEPDLTEQRDWHSDLILHFAEFLLIFFITRYNMTNNLSEKSLETIKVLQESQKNIKIWIGAIMGVILILFFFTFASLVDKAPPMFFAIETIITIIIIPCFFMLNRISFAVLKMKKGKKEEFKSILTKMHRDDVDKKTEEILEKVTA